MPFRHEDLRDAWIVLVTHPLIHSLVRPQMGNEQVHQPICGVTKFNSGVGLDMSCHYFNSKDDSNWLLW